MKCNVKKCFASCCYNVPFPKGFIELHKDAIINKPLEVKEVPRKSKDGCEFGEFAYVSYFWLENKCPFLTEDCKCNIYNYRPMICRKFGETENLKCHERIQ